MPTKVVAFVLSVLSFFAVWNMNGQPNSIPETREYIGEVPDKYGVWPAEEFEKGEKPWWLSVRLVEWGIALKEAFGGKTRMNSLLVLHRGKLVHEAYYGPQDSGWPADSPHHVQSITKGVLAALVGIAIEEGLIEGVDQKVIDFFPEAVIAPGQESKRDITIEHLLTHTSGLPGDGEAMLAWWRGDDGYWYGEDGDPGDLGIAAFELPQTGTPGKKHNYSRIGAYVLACALSRRAGMSVYEYAQEKLFEPTGITSARWDTYYDGSCIGGYGLFLTPRDMARFGYLYLNYGHWDDRQVVPAQWVARTPPRSKSILAYGYMVRNNPLLPLGSSYEFTGLYGQLISVIPAFDLVVVRTGSKIV